jgi:NADH-quinone oxidoreductase subunit C
VPNRALISAPVRATAPNRALCFVLHEPSIASLTEFIGGAEWHEREAHEMFGIDFVGNKNLTPLYLPDAFVGHPLLKSYPLISREVKPWPGDVDVEPMPEPETDPVEEGPS